MITNIKQLPLVQWANTGFQNTAIGSQALYEFHKPVTNTIIFSANPEQEMLKITEDGFYVRGVKVEQDEKEAAVVYKAFKRWMVENELRRSW